MADGRRSDDMEPGVDDPGLEAFARRISAPLRQVELPADDFGARLEARLRREQADQVLRVVRNDLPRAPQQDIPRRPAADLPRAPRTVRLSPVTGFLAAASLTLAVSLGAWWGGQRAAGTVDAAPPVVASAPAAAPARVDTVRVVQFVFVAPGAQQVTLVGDFNDWRPEATPMSADAARGLWTVEVPLAPGRHQYAFVVDGARWVADPRAPRAVEDDFGTPSSVITIGERQS